MKKIILGLFLGSILTSCATKPNWNNRHYQNSNKGAEANQLCNTGQIQAANRLGYNCVPKSSQNRAISSSNGNISNIYLNSTGTAQNRNNELNMYKLMNNLYNQERNDRLNRICTFNGTCK